MAFPAYKAMPLFERSRCVNPFLLKYPFFLLCTQQSILASGPVESSPYQNGKTNFKRVHDLDTPILFWVTLQNPSALSSTNQLFLPLGVSNSTGGSMTSTTAPLSLPRLSFLLCFSFSFVGLAWMDGFVLSALVNQLLSPHLLVLLLPLYAFCSSLVFDNTHRPAVLSSIFVSLAVPILYTLYISKNEEPGTGARKVTLNTGGNIHV